MSNYWTADLRKQWDATWSQPHMQAGLKELVLRTKKSPIKLETTAGYDALVLAAGEHHRAVGHQEILDHIEEMRQEKAERKPLPQPWTPEARGEQQPTSEDTL